MLWNIEGGSAQNNLEELHSKGETSEKRDNLDLVSILSHEKKKGA